MEENKELQPGEETEESTEEKTEESTEETEPETEPEKADEPVKKKRVAQCDCGKVYAKIPKSGICGQCLRHGCFTFRSQIVTK